MAYTYRYAILACHLPNKLVDRSHLCFLKLGRRDHLSGKLLSTIVSERLHVAENTMRHCQYQSFVTSQFLGHSLLGAVASVSAIVIAVGKPVAAKFADVLGRAESWIVAITLYTIVGLTPPL